MYLNSSTHISDELETISKYKVSFITTSNFVARLQRQVLQSEVSAKWIEYVGIGNAFENFDDAVKDNKWYSHIMMEKHKDALRFKTDPKVSVGQLEAKYYKEAVFLTMREALSYFADLSYEKSLEDVFEELDI